MTNPIRDCTICGQAFLSVPTHNDAPAVCPECSEITASPEAKVTEAPPERPRFVALSALPPEKRLPPRRTLPDTVAPAAMQVRTAVRPDPITAGDTLPAPRRVEQSRVIAPSLSAPAVPPAVSSPREPVPVPAIPAALQQIGFNCPSCFTILVIKDPAGYDGRAAPCPYCAVTILPPRVAPPSPFTLVAAEPLPPPASNPGRLKWTNFQSRPHEAEAEVA